jgi:hypothetical protein
MIHDVLVRVPRGLRQQMSCSGNSNSQNSEVLARTAEIRTLIEKKYIPH